MLPTTELSLKEKVLESSRHILAREGYKGLSMRKIAKLVDCKAASIYHHFENKDKIVHTLIDEGYQYQLKVLDKAVEGIEDPLKRIETRIRAFIDFGLENPELYHIMYILYTKDMERYPKENYRRNTRNIKKTIEDLKLAQASNLIDLDSAPEIIANAGSAMLHGLISLLLTDRLHFKLDKEQLKETIVQQVLKLNGFRK